jgi:hypothetical protein
MRRFLLRFVVLLASVIPGGVSAAEGDLVITGRVTNQEDGSGVANANVTIAELKLSATTDRTGRYT